MQYILFAKFFESLRHPSGLTGFSAFCDESRTEKNPHGLYGKCLKNIWIKCSYSGQCSIWVFSKKDKCESNPLRIEMYHENDPWSKLINFWSIKLPPNSPHYSIHRFFVFILVIFFGEKDVISDIRDFFQNKHRFLGDIISLS